MKSQRMFRKSRKYRLMAVALLVVVSFMLPIHVSASEYINENDMRIETLNMVMRNKYIKEEAIVMNPMKEATFLRGDTISNNLEGKSIRNWQYVNFHPISYQVHTETKGIAEHHGDGSGVIHIGTTTLDHTVINPLICLIVLCGYTLMLFGNSKSEGYLC